MFATLDSDAHLRGIRGWLIVVAVKLVLVPLCLLVIIALDFDFLASPGRIRLEEMLPGFSFLVVFEVLTSATMLLVGLWLLVPFFRKKRFFPRCYQIWLACLVAIFLAQLTFCPRSVAPGVENASLIAILANVHAALVRAAVEGSLSAVIWISYFAVSRRVKATFVN